MKSLNEHKTLLKQKQIETLLESGEIDNIKMLLLDPSSVELALTIGESMGMDMEKISNELLPIEFVYQYNNHPSEFRQKELKDKIIKLLELEDIGFRKLKSVDDLPESFANLKNIRQIHLDGNRLPKISSNFFNILSKLPKLQELDISGNNLKDVPKEIGNLNNLEILALDENQINSLPKEIGNLKNLKILDLRYNQLKEIPKEIGNLKNLDIMYLGENKLNDVPKEVKELKNLRIWWGE